jgi:3'-phosphoadenosine 5'-phosphosulfate sulfotransferase (PAPS reductase)/FAD synthetase
MTSLSSPQEIITNALGTITPSAAICLFSGGYDSMISTILAHQYWRDNNVQIPLITYSIDTMLSADGWREFVTTTAGELGFADHRIFSNEGGYNEFVELVQDHGCPYSRQGHNAVFNRLKDRAIATIIRNHKQEFNGRKKFNDRIALISGMRRDESPGRANLPEFQQRGDTAGWFIAPLIYWTNEETMAWRIEKELPANPFYETVGGSGDCQCNWGNFITLPELEKHAPHTAVKVREIDAISRDLHGYGWDEKPDWKLRRKIDAGEVPLFDLSNLCAGCSRPKPHASEAEALAQMREVF